MRIRLLIAGALLPLALWALLPLQSDGASPRSRLNDVQSKIRATESRIGRRKGTERVRFDANEQVPAHDDAILHVEKSPP